MTTGVSIYFTTENVPNFPLKFSKPKIDLTPQSQSIMSLKDMAISQMLLVYMNIFDSRLHGLFSVVQKNKEQNLKRCDNIRRTISSSTNTGLNARLKNKYCFGLTVIN